MGKAKDIQVSYIGVNELTPYDKNAKKHTEEQLSAIAESIKEFGFSQPIVAWHDESGRAVVVAGHGRLKAAKRLKMDSVPVVFVDDLNDDQRRALTLADNQTTMMTGWDATALDFELTDLAEVFDMSGFGFKLSGENEQDEIEGSEPFATALDTKHDYIVLKFENEIDFMYASQLLGLEKCDLLATGKNKRFGIGRVVDGVAALERITADED